jgi:hypothetical protein
MTTTELLTRLADRHVILCPAGPDRLRFYPSSAVDSQLREALRKLKPDILRLVPPGWPEDVPIPSWWPELAGAFPRGFLREAKRGECLDPDCRFPVAVQWFDRRDRRFVWSCPACGLESGCRPIH